MDGDGIIFVKSMMICLYQPLISIICYYCSNAFRVDHLYAFFIQWSPDIYGEDMGTESEAFRRGFVVIKDDGEELEHTGEEERGRKENNKIKYFVFKFNAALY